MPYYSYKCNECDYSFEELCKLSERDAPITSPCPNCNTSGNIKQELSSFLLGDPFMYGSASSKRPERSFQEGVLDRVKKQPKFSAQAGRLEK